MWLKKTTLTRSQASLSNPKQQHSAHEEHPGQLNGAIMVQLFCHADLISSSPTELKRFASEVVHRDKSSLTWMLPSVKVPAYLTGWQGSIGAAWWEGFDLFGWGRRQACTQKCSHSSRKNPKSQSRSSYRCHSIFSGCYEALSSQRTQAAAAKSQMGIMAEIQRNTSPCPVSLLLWHAGSCK